MGVGRRLRRHNPEVRIVAAEPLPGERVQGLRSLDEGFIPEIFDPTVLDRKTPRLQRTGHRGAARADREGGHLRGRLLRRGRWSPRSSWPARWTHGTIVALLADGGWKYLSEDVWTRDLEADEDVVDSLNLW